MTYLACPHTLLAGMKNGVAAVKTSVVAPQKVRCRDYPAIPLVGIYPRKQMSTQKLMLNVPNSIIHNTCKLETAQMPINW